MLDRGPRAKRHPCAIRDQVLDRQGDALLFLSRDGFAGQVADILALLAQLHLSLAALHQCRVVKVAQVGADGLHRNVQTLR